MEHPPSEGKPLDDESSISKQDVDDDCERENRMETGVETGMETGVETGVDAPGMETGTD